MNGNLPPNNGSREYCSALAQLVGRTSNPKLGLSRIRALLDVINFDRSRMRIIQVVGTNGKGSTTAFIESILRAHGIACGLFTSPHLCTARERIRIDGELISEADFVLATKHVLAAAERLEDEASFFECMLAMAMWTMQRRGIKVAIIEAGLGGRLDATTALDADVLGITSIDFDHQNILGADLASIAREKISAGRMNQPVISVVQSEEVDLALVAYAQEIGCVLSHSSPTDLPLGLHGNHQTVNAGLAIALLRALGVDISMHATCEGLMLVAWPGRFEIMPGNMPLVLDGAHNPAGINSLVETLKDHRRFRHQPLVLVYGSLDGPNVEGKITALKASGLPIVRIYIHEPKNLRAINSMDLHKVLTHAGFANDLLRLYASMIDVRQDAQSLNAGIVVCGSLYTVGEIRSEVLGIKMDSMAPIY